MTTPTQDPDVGEILAAAFRALEPVQYHPAVLRPAAPSPGRDPDTGAPLFFPTPVFDADTAPLFLGDVDGLEDDLDVELGDGAMPAELAGFRERAAPALALCLPHLTRVGSGNNGIIGNDAHSYGYHLSRNRLLGTGHRGDYSITGPHDVGGPNDTACALDLFMHGWPASRAWVSWARAERAAGRLPEIAELIGSPDGKRALYAADTTGWRWTVYQGEGHISWTHVAIYRQSANNASFATRAFGRWTRNGLVTPRPTPRPPKPTAATYTVQTGDTLVSIGEKTGVPWQTISVLNRIRRPYTVHKGQVLRLRAAPRPAPKPPKPPKPTTYRVRAGDSGLIEIAERVGVPWQTIASLNRLRPPYIIHKGQLLRIRASAARHVQPAAFAEAALPDGGVAALPALTPAKILGRWRAGDGSDLLGFYATTLPVLACGMGHVTGHGEYVSLIRDALNARGAHIAGLGTEPAFDGDVYMKAMMWKAAHGVGPYTMPGQPLSGFDYADEWGTASWASILGQTLIAA